MIFKWCICSFITKNIVLHHLQCSRQFWSIIVSELLFTYLYVFFLSFWNISVDLAQTFKHWAQVLYRLFFAHLSTKCSWWAIVKGFCPLSVVGHHASCVVLQHCYLHIFSEMAKWILTKLYSNDPCGQKMDSPKLLVPFHKTTQEWSKSEPHPK